LKRVFICLSPYIQKKQALKKDESGFTLMEIITVIAIMSIVIGMIFSFLVFNVDGLNYGSGQTKEQANLRMAALRITDEIRNSKEIQLSDDALGMDYEIYLQKNSLVLDDGPTTITLSGDKINSVYFDLREHKEESEYKKRYLLIITLETQGNTLDTEVLLNNISDIDVDMSGKRLGFNLPDALSP